MTPAQRAQLTILRQTESVVHVIETKLPPRRVIVYIDDGDHGNAEAQIHEDGRTYWSDAA